MGIFYWVSIISYLHPPNSLLRGLRTTNYGTGSGTRSRSTARDGRLVSLKGPQVAGMEVGWTQRKREKRRETRKLLERILPHTHLLQVTVHVQGGSDQRQHQDEDAEVSHNGTGAFLPHSIEIPRLSFSPVAAAATSVLRLPAATLQRLPVLRVIGTPGEGENPPQLSLVSITIFLRPELLPNLDSRDRQSVVVLWRDDLRLLPLVATEKLPQDDEEGDSAKDNRRRHEDSLHFARNMFQRRRTARRGTALDED